MGLWLSSTYFQQRCFFTFPFPILLFGLAAHSSVPALHDSGPPRAAAVKDGPPLGAARLGLSLTAASTAAGSVCIGIAFLSSLAPLHRGLSPPAWGPIDIIGQTTVGPLGRQSAARSQDERGGACLWWRSSHHNLVFGGPLGIRTMMQSCASAARLLGGGPILSQGIVARVGCGSPPPRIDLALASRRGRIQCRIGVWCVSGCSLDLSRQFAHVAGLNTAPAGTSPVVT